MLQTNSSFFFVYLRTHEELDEQWLALRRDLSYGSNHNINVIFLVDGNPVAYIVAKNRCEEFGVISKGNIHYTLISELIEQYNLWEIVKHITSGSKLDFDVYSDPRVQNPNIKFYLWNDYLLCRSEILRLIKD